LGVKYRERKKTRKDKKEKREEIIVEEGIKSRGWEGWR
jgi:hypothetical protein